MKLSKQANATLLMALQKCLLEQSDITVILDNLDFEVSGEGELIVNNPPAFKLDNGELGETSL
tara:strand:- start:846 stop:1034 length:189 start_codon:yes stop_codon:yes gene_type:complete